MSEKTCDMCRKSTNTSDDVLKFGDWLTKCNVNVHYFCLLLATNLPQRGSDSTGMLGFLIRDIRQEIKCAGKRVCVFCNDIGATIACHKCNEYFHLMCGFAGRCTFQFANEFHSYCYNCAPMDDYMRQLQSNPPEDVFCDICMRPIKPFILQFVNYADCCRQGFVHRACMRRYAIAAGYYLRCLWCRDTKFREFLRMHSIFVPDRDATWESVPNAYRELHHKLMRCDIKKCHCPKGRSYNDATWLIMQCSWCASTGAHAKCIVGVTRVTNGMKLPNEFTCNACLEIEDELKKKSNNETAGSFTEINNQQPVNQLNNSFYMSKKPSKSVAASTNDDSPVFSNDETMSNVSQVTVIHAPSPVLRSSTASITPSPKDVEIPETPPVEPTSYSSPITISDSSPNNEEVDTDTSVQCLQLCKSFEVPGRPYFYLVIYNFDEKTQDCIGSSTLRFAQDDERIKDRSQPALERIELREGDILFSTENRGIYELVDQYIAAFKN